MRSKSAYAIVFVLVLIVDQAFKIYFMATPESRTGVFAIHLNNFFAWSLPVSNSVSLALALAVCALLVAWLFYSRAARSSFGAWLILAGALSNIIDRLRVGGVIDYLAIPFGARINIADLAIAAGVIILLAKK